MTHCSACKLHLKWLDGNGLHNNDDGYISYNTKLNVSHFKGESTLKVAFSRQALLYYHDSKSYPVVDFFVFLPGANAKDDILWAIQVTRLLNHNEHIRKDAIKFRSKQLIHSKYRKDKVAPFEQEKWAKYCNIPTKNVIIVRFLRHMPSPCNEQKCLFLLWDGF